MAGGVRREDATLCCIEGNGESASTGDFNVWHLRSVDIPSSRGCTATVSKMVIDDDYPQLRRFLGVRRPIEVVGVLGADHVRLGDLV
jgi:hypothetical protein